MKNDACLRPLEIIVKVIKILTVKFVLTCTLFVIQFCLKAQLKNNPAHVLSFEGGMFNRGLIGASYLRLFLQNNRFLVGSGGGFGIGGVPFGGGVNQFYYLTLGTGIGVKDGTSQYYLTLGLDLKYINYFDGNYDVVLDDYISIHYEGFGAMPYFGLSVIEENIFIQMRSAPLYLMRRFKIESKTWGVGLTAGVVIR